MAHLYIALTKEHISNNKWHINDYVVIVAEYVEGKFKIETLNTERDAIPTILVVTFEGEVSPRAEQHIHSQIYEREITCAEVFAENGLKFPKV